jgi:D-lactate dehydrogenase
MKIAFFEMSKDEQADMRSALASVLVVNAEAGAVSPSNTSANVVQPELIFSEEKLSLKTIAMVADADIVSVFINSMVSREVIDALPKLKFISTRSSGYDHVDVAYATSKNISVANVPAYGPHTVAEFSYALLLALSRKIINAYNHLRADEDFDLSNLTGFDLYGKTIGIVGTGRIGKNSAQIARGFGMNIIAYDVFPDEKFAAQVGMKYVDFPTLLSSSDIVTLHAPYTKDSYHLINKENIKTFKKGALLINTARGELVDTDALIWALNEGIIAGAGLDVLEGERFMKEEVDRLLGDNAGQDKNDQDKNSYKTILEDHSLIHNPRVIVTPHMAFSSREAKSEILSVSATNIQAFLGGGAPQNLVR